MGLDTTENMAVYRWTWICRRGEQACGMTKTTRGTRPSILQIRFVVRIFPHTVSQTCRWQPQVYCQDFLSCSFLRWQSSRTLVLELG
ncbi:hypothetical protein JOB18_044181 [Solea senegalensis]|uniref:Uncharacterized protein n=1 Tax=Solea senegalensis TaxID=28829 RepID=A0AAV6SVM3_SOLSE|nr:hypothetical protein JOB18_044181 [Solea senegalensis]